MAKAPEVAQKDALACTPSGRFGQPQDLADTVLRLVSAQAVIINGQYKTVDSRLTSAMPLQSAFF